ncbi:uncharacterized protein LOC128396070 [Panonychus citri]|uniref:uncharacterized protein LOC128396070 n=1 Tax=Panonychus citri TaxID=50023 RepID=UPI002307B9F6|nr:uncharacterized protein LOC128396070 [Panonychus citri]
MKLSISLIVVITFSTVYGATIKKEEFVDLCQAAGKLLVYGLSPASVQQVLKQRSELSILQRSEEQLDSSNELYDEFASKFVESITNLFVDAIVQMNNDQRIFRESSTLSPARSQEVENLKISSVSAFCKQLPLPDSIDTTNPITTLTAIVNYVNNLQPLVSSMKI